MSATQKFSNTALQTWWWDRNMRWNVPSETATMLIFTRNPSTSVAMVLQAHCCNKCARVHMLQLAQAQYKHSPSYTHTSSGTPNCFVASPLGVFSFWEVPVCCTWNTDLESGLVTSWTGVVNFASYLHQNISTTYSVYQNSELNNTHLVMHVG